VSGLWRFWRWPLLAAGVTLVLAGAVIAGLLLKLAGLDPEKSTAPSLEAQVEQHLQGGQSAIDTGSFHLAARELSLAIDKEQQMPQHWLPERRRQIVQQQRQAALVADLLTDSPAEIIRNSLGMHEAEWKAVFEQNYAHRSIILDDTLHRDAAGYHLSYKIRVAGSQAKWDLSALMLLQRFDLFQPRRVLLGLRLAGIHREPKGDWLLLPEPDSGVLLTDARFFSGLSVAVDREMEDVLKSQQELLR